MIIIESSYFHVANQDDLVTNDVWPGVFGQLKTNTVQYFNMILISEMLNNGAPALVEQPKRNERNTN